MPTNGDFGLGPVDDYRRSGMQPPEEKKGGLFDSITNLFIAKKSRALANYQAILKKYENRLNELEGRIRKIEGQYKENKINQSAMLNLIDIKAKVLQQMDDLKDYNKNVINVKALIDVNKHIRHVEEYLATFETISKDVELKKAPELPAPLPPPPESGIKIGLPNIGNTCFANSFLKLIAQTTYFDGLLNNEPNEEYKELHLILRDIVHTLRTAKPFKGCIISKQDCHKLMKKLQALIQMGDPDFQIGRQADSVEVLQLMMMLFGFQLADKLAPEQYEHVPVEFLSFTGRKDEKIDDSFIELLMEHVKKMRGKKSVEPILSVSCDQEDKLIDVNEKLLGKDVLKGRKFKVPRDIKGQLPGKKGPKASYIEISIIKKLPQILTISVKRKGLLEDQFNASPIATGKDGYVTIEEYPDFDLKSAANIEDLQRKARPVKYRIKSAILHHKPDIDHYTMVEWDGKDYIHHNDRAVTKGIDFNFIKEHGVFYMLEQVD